MSTTPDMAPGRTTAAAVRRANGAAATTPRRSSPRRRAVRDDGLEAQVAQLQNDLKGIAASLASIAEQKVGEAQSMAKREVKSLAKSGQQAVEDVQDEFGALEKQIKDTIREKPLTAVAGAIALGFVLAVVSR